MHHHFFFILLGVKINFLNAEDHNLEIKRLASVLRARCHLKCN